MSKCNIHHDHWHRGCKDCESDADKPVCAICGKPLAGQTWTDDDEFGDVHEQCLDEKRTHHED